MMISTAAKCVPLVSKRLRQLLFAGLLLQGAHTEVLAQIHTDSSLGHPAQSLVGPNYVIPQSIGQLNGNNLFESFSTFNLANGESASFTTSSPSIANIISRVTGGTPSILNGNINVLAAGGAPNLFFINPAGVTFGNGAGINVPAAFHVSTASYLKFPNGRFYSDTAHVSTFSAMAPEAFGFLGTARASVNVTDNTFLAQGGAPITITAGDIVVDNATVATFGGGDVRIAAVGADQIEVPLTGPMPALHGSLEVVNGGSVAALATGSDGGNVIVSAGSIGIDARGSSYFTGIYTDAPQGSVANAGIVQVNAGTVQLTNSGAISSTTESSGNAGGVTVTASGAIALSASAQIYSAAYDTGNAGAVHVSASDLSLVGNNMPNGTSISSNALEGQGNAGNVFIAASGNVSLAQGAYITADTLTAGSGGNVYLGVHGGLNVTSGSFISADALGSGSAGSVNVAAGSIALTGSSNSFTGISSNSEGATSGPAGSVTVTSNGAISILSGADITSTSKSVFDAGSISVTGASLYISGGSQSVAATGISTNAIEALGSAGTVNVDVTGALTILNGGGIGSQSELSYGNSGSVKVNAGSLLINSQGNAAGASISSDNSSFNSASKGGSVEVQVAGNLTLLGSGEISADTFFRGDAGAVTVDAGNILIEGAGIGSNAGITSQSLGRRSGNAGSVAVTSAGSISLLDAGTISSSTFASAGRAGTVVVAGRDITVDGFLSSINAEALPGSSGQTGGVKVSATNSIALNNEGELSVANGATVADPNAITASLLSVSAPTITLSSESAITAIALGNVPASNILIRFGKVLSLDPSAISTDSINGNGGSITIEGGQLLELNQSQITTSVFGASGNGGNISINSAILILNSGFIQANTVATKGVGGNVLIDTPALVTSGDSLFLGGSTPYSFGPQVFGFNVIQAAAPTGISGNVQISNPALDLAATLQALGGKVVDSGGLRRDRCHTQDGSSLVMGGHGGLAPSAQGLVRADPQSEKEGAAKRDENQRVALLLSKCPEH